MSVVTMTGHLGSMGEVAHIVAQRLDYDVVDRELLLEAAEALGWSEEQVADFDERTDGQGGRLIRLLRTFVERAGQSDLTALAGAGMESVLTRTYAETSSPEMRPDKERYSKVLRQTIEQLTERGRIVIVGRGAQAILAGRPGTLHVRVVCDLEERARRVALRTGEPVEEARRRVEESDKQREAWHEEYFDLDYRAPYHYHLIANTGLLSDEEAADLVVRACETRFDASG